MYTMYKHIHRYNTVRIKYLHICAYSNTIPTQMHKNMMCMQIAKPTTKINNPSPPWEL